MPSERRILASTDSTEVYPHTPSPDTQDCAGQSPKAKKPRTAATRTAPSEPLLLLASEPPTNGDCERVEELYSQASVPPSAVHHTCTLVSYKVVPAHRCNITILTKLIKADVYVSVWCSLRFRMICPGLRTTSTCLRQGTVTRCIAAEWGVYELDGRLRLYLTHRHCLELGRGLRRGAAVELHNVHLVRVPPSGLKVRVLASS